jgi:hypothetical protein
VVNLKKGFVTPVVLLFVVVAALAAADYFVFYRHTPPPPVDQISQTKTYINAQYGFSLNYPSSLTVEILNDDPKTPFEATPIIRIQDHGNLTDQIDGYLVVYVSSDPTDLTHCGVSTSISVVRNGKCFVVGVDVLPVTNDSREFPKPPGYAAEYDRIQDELNKVAETFKFTDSASSVSVPGMSKYTDSDFGFSFWYPSGWTVRKTMDARCDNPSGEKLIGAIEISSQDTPISNGNKTMYLCESSSPSGISESGGKYADTAYYDKQKNSWMVKSDWDPTKGLGTYISQIPTSATTMGGLQYLLGYDAVALSKEKFVTAIVSDDSFKALMNTIVATDPSVATPASATEQIKAIQAEKAAYIPAAQSLENTSATTTVALRIGDSIGVAWRDINGNDQFSGRTVTNFTLSSIQGGNVTLTVKPLAGQRIPNNTVTTKNGVASQMAMYMNDSYPLFRIHVLSTTANTATIQFVSDWAAGGF